MTAPGLQLAVAEPAVLGESPFWHPHEQALYYCDIPGRELRRFDPASGALRTWQFDTEVASCAPCLDGTLLLACRDGLWRFEPASGQRRLLAAPPYDPKRQRFNDGKCDPQGRFWVGTLSDQRLPEASLYCWANGELHTAAGGITVSNGLGFSPDGCTLYWADTKAHRIDAFDLDPGDGSLSGRRLFAQFPPRHPGQAAADYGGRPDGAAVDVQGCYWVAMYEGARLLRLSAQGELLREIPLPLRFATMPCFGGADLRTLFITTARQGLSDEELAAQPWAGGVLSLRVDVPGLPVNFSL